MYTNGIIDKVDPSTLIYIKNEPNTKGSLGVPYNKIVEVPNFITPEIAPKMIKFFEECDVDWGDIAFYGSSGKGIKADEEYLKSFGLSGTFFADIKNKFQETLESIFDRKLRANTSHAQKWDVGGFASVHSDNSSNDGEPNAFEINKYVAILYINDDYEGGNLYFPDHDISFKPNAYSLYTFPGGVENLHGVSEILAGTRYTMVSFWDFADLEYDQETLDRWDEEVKQVRIAQAKQKEEWRNGNKFA